MRHRLCQKACRRDDFSEMNHSITTFLPVDRQFLRHSISALTWNLVSLYFCCGFYSRSTERKAVGNAGKGNPKKQMPSCNGKDRVKVKAVVTAVEADGLIRKDADFGVVCQRNVTEQLISGSQ